VQVFEKSWWKGRDSNPRPRHYELRSRRVAHANQDGTKPEAQARSFACGVWRSQLDLIAQKLAQCNLLSANTPLDSASAVPCHGRTSVTQMRSSSRLWAAYFNGPLYVPEEGRDVLQFLESGGPSRFTDELKRLSTLGSPWASAILGYIALMPGPERTRDTDRAIELCKGHAHGGDSYAQFVLAWALIYHGETNLAYETMKKAMLTGFPPATLDFAVFIWHGWGTQERYPRLALRALRRADQTGHKAAFEWRCFFYKSGQLGIARRLIGYVLAPIGRLRYILALSRDPFSCRVFKFQIGTTGPLLRQQPAGRARETP